MPSQKKNEVDLNRADFNEIASLPMVGEKRAHFIIDNRPFKSWSDVAHKVPGLSEGMIEDLKKGNATIDGKK